MRTWRVALAFQLIAGTAAAQGDPAAGRRLAEAQCSSCHAIGPGRSGPALPGVTPFQAVAERTATTSLSLQAFLRTPHAHMPNIVLDGQQLDDVIAYILSLRAAR
ncbi:c-type cytochrome [Falsiroseomonas oryziterrae]|uniref:c-type cytochrome n=1 Tax=Falsiroseomonas oryziterrae TaxID=2911368 RepID=UPI001EFFEA2D|nr:cytochrome c [Roseomonas sp. NPKOSM-4]